MHEQPSQQDSSADNEVVDSGVLEEITSEGGEGGASPSGPTKPEANATYRSMLRRYGLRKGNLAQFSQRLLEKDFDSFVVVKERQLMEEYNFTKKEVRSIIKAKPTVLLYEEEYERNRRGIKALYKVIVEEKGFSESQAKELVVRYPVILQKSESELENFFNVLKRYNVPKQEAMDQLMQVPKLISQNLEVKFKEFIFLFELYLKME
jgi:hypothetical protein